MYYPKYGFSIDQTQSDPNNVISYIGLNKDYTPVHMDYDNDVFDYGDWGNAFFIKNLRPCMLNYNGTEAYLLDPNDYTKKLDGTDSDATNSDFAGNVMVGIPKVYFKIVPIDDDHCNFYFSETKRDGYHCWAHINNYGDEVPYMYMPAYDGSNVDSVLRSISGLDAIWKAENIQIIADYAYANNQDDDNIWSMNTYSDWLLIVLLSLLISKTTDSKTAFGKGNYSARSTQNYGMIKSGTMDQKGLFWGSTDNTIGVKIFGIENFWGNINRLMYGLINYYGTQKVKLTYGTQDGSTVEGYNFTGDGYIEAGSTLRGSNRLYYLSKMTFTENGIFIKDISGTAGTTYGNTIPYYDHSKLEIACIGNNTGYTLLLGIYFITNSSSYAGGSPKCLPKLVS
jgi:hypothetical protein